jgi:hypothetical protein
LVKADIPMRLTLLLSVVLLVVNLSAFAQEPPSQSAGSGADPSRDASTATYKRLLDEADAALKAHDLPAALAGFTAVAERNPTEVPAALRAEAVRGLVSVQSELQRDERARREQQPTVAQSLRRFWSFYLFPVSPSVAWFGVLLLALAGIRSRAQSRPRPNTRVAFEDLSAASAERPDKNRILTRSILNLLQNPKPVQMSDLHMDIMPGTDEAGFGSLQTALEMESVSGYEPSDRPMKIAAFEFTVRDVAALFSQVFARPYESYLEGWLNNTPDGAEAFAQKLDAARDPLTAQTWRVRRVGPRAREEAIADLAAQVLVGTMKSTLTDSWQSFRSFHEAMKLRQDSARDRLSSEMSMARSYLEQAVTYDASNWIARLQSAGTIRHAR